MTAIEWMIKQLNINGTVIPMEIESKAKEMEKEQREELYNETEVLQLLIKLKQTEYFDNLYEWFEKNKKCYHPLNDRKHTSDTHFECTICGYNNY